MQLFQKKNEVLKGIQHSRCHQNHYGQISRLGCSRTLSDIKSHPWLCPSASAVISRLPRLSLATATPAVSKLHLLRRRRRRRWRPVPAAGRARVSPSAGAGAGAADWPPASRPCHPPPPSAPALSAARLPSSEPPGSRTHGAARSGSNE